MKKTRKANKSANLSKWVGQENSRKHKHIIKQLIIKHKGLCAICGEQISLKQGTPSYATVDHIIPTHCNGLDKPDNWQLACSKCNNEKGCTYE